MIDNFDSILFRVKSIFSFKDLPLSTCICKIIFICLFGTAYFTFELYGLFFMLMGFIPIIGFIFSIVGCFICDTISGFLFYLIMLPHTSYMDNKKQSTTQTTSKNDVSHKTTTQKDVEVEIGEKKTQANKTQHNDVEKEIVVEDNKEFVSKLELNETEYQEVNNAIAWCFGQVDIAIENVLSKYKDDLFLGEFSGKQAFELKNIFFNVKQSVNNSTLDLKLEKAIFILEKHMYK